MKRREFLKWCTGGVAFIAAGSWCFRGALFAVPTPRTNILLIVADDLGYNDMACAGGNVITPRLDALAKQGIRLTSLYAQPVCSPSRASLLTGRYPQRNGMTDALQDWDQSAMGAGLSHKEKLLPRYLKKAGYATGMFGKWHLGFAPGSRPTQRGFDHFFGQATGMVDYYTHTGVRGEMDLWREETPVNMPGYSTDLYANAAIKYIEHNKDKPFFVYLAFNAPHEGVGHNDNPGHHGIIPAPERYLNLYAGEQDPIRKHYVASVTVMDAAIGKVLERLEQLKLTDSTLVVFFSDNGGDIENGADNTPLRGTKLELFEGGIRVPGIVYWPGIVEGGKICDEMISEMDFFSLAMRAANAPLPPPEQRIIDGIDPTDVLAGKSPAKRKYLFFRYKNTWSVRNEQYKLLKIFNKDKVKTALFDLLNDRQEKHNLEEEQAVTVTQLEAAYHQWKEEVSHFAKPSSDEASPL